MVDLTVNSVQEACSKCFAVHTIKIWNLANHMKKKETKNIRLLFFSFSKNLALWCFYFVFHGVWKISNFIMCTAKHLEQASCTDFTLLWMYIFTHNFMKKWGKKESFGIKHGRLVLPIIYFKSKSTLLLQNKHNFIFI